MRQEHWAELDVVIAGGDDRRGGGDGPLLVLLHGFGAPGTDLVGLWRVFDVPSSVRYVFPAGPQSLAPIYGDARAWWDIDMMEYQRRLMLGQQRALAEQTPPEMLERRDQIANLLNVCRAELGPSHLLLGGFSQGAMLATETALFGGVPIDGLLLMSGSLLSADRWVPAFEKLRKVPVFQSHGQQDPVLEFSVAEELHYKLIEASVPTTWTPFRGGHEIPPVVVQNASQFIRDVIEPVAP